MPPIYRWNAPAARYVLATGVFVPRTPVRHALDVALQREANDMRALADRLRDGRITVAQWQRQMRQQMKSLHIYSATIANGGAAQMGPRQYGRVGAVLKKQYRYLDRFAGQIARGEVPLDGRFMQRVDLYAHAGRVTYTTEDGRVHKAAGYREERSVLHVADHCNECMDEAQRGWVSIGTVTPPGSRQCLSRCHCTMEYRK